MSERIIDSSRFIPLDIYHHVNFDTRTPRAVYQTIDVALSRLHGQSVIADDVFMEVVPLVQTFPTVSFSDLDIVDFVVNGNALHQWRVYGEEDVAYQEVSLWPDPEAIDREVTGVYQQIFDSGNIVQKNRQLQAQRELPNAIVNPSTGIVLQKAGNEMAILTLDHTLWICGELKEYYEAGYTDIFRYHIDGEPPFFFEYDVPYSVKPNGVAEPVGTLTLGMALASNNAEALIETAEVVLENNGSQEDLQKLVQPYVHLKLDG
jgi:hypothetical protein